MMKDPLSFPPEPKTESHWRPFTLPLRIGSGRRSIFGEKAIRMAYFQNAHDQSLIGRAWFGKESEGPPRHVHGGVSFYVLDEAMGSASWLSGYACVAADIDVSFLEMTPLGTDYLIEAKVVRVEGQNVFLEAQIKDEKGTVYTKTLGRFHRLAKGKLKRIVEAEGLDVDLLNIKFFEDEKV